MYALTMNQIDVVSGGTGGTLAHPIVHPQSEAGKTIDDAAQMLNTFGNWLGGEIYQATH